MGVVERKVWKIQRLDGCGSKAWQEQEVERHGRKDGKKYWQDGVVKRGSRKGGGRRQEWRIGRKTKVVNEWWQIGEGVKTFNENNGKLER